MVEREKLLVFAKFFACPYVLNLDAVKPFTKDVSIILVGSLATGVNHEQSNVDLCILCKRKVAAEINKEIHWTGNNCTELTIDGVRTRYYIAELETVLNELNNHDDMAYYLYANAIALDDVSGAFKNLQKYIRDEKFVQRRKRHIFRQLLRKRRAIAAYLESAKDPVGRMIQATSLLKALLRAIAEFDGVPFDPKKYPYRTALSGETGKILTPCVDALLALAGRLSNLEDIQAQKEFIYLVDNCISAIT